MSSRRLFTFTIVLCACLCSVAIAQPGRAPSDDVAAAGTGGGADARGDIPRIRGQATMPANGVLVLEIGESDAVTVSMTDSEGMVIDGSTRAVTTLSTASLLIVWKPELELVPGSYAVTLSALYSGATPSMQVEVVPAIPDELPPIAGSPSTSVITGNSTSECCGSPFENQSFEKCFPTMQMIVASVQAGVSSSAAVSRTAQYLFRLKDDELDSSGLLETGLWTPLELLEGVVFRERRDEYCVVLEAQNLATEEVESYEDPLCAPGVDRELGSFDVEVENSTLVQSSCWLPPPQYQGRWCKINEHACDTRPSADCEHYDHVCNDGPVPVAWQGLGGPIFSANPSSDGCSTNPRARSHSMLAALLPVVAMLAARRRFR